jgi:hypothetical protein
VLDRLPAMAGTIKITPARTDVERSALKLPDCALPRPGEHVTWFKLAVMHTGVLLGHTHDGRPHIETQSGHEFADSFEVIRRADREGVSNPIWEPLPGNARFVLPVKHEADAFRSLLLRMAPPGTRPRDLMSEVYERGYEIFLCGRTVRDILTGRPPAFAEIVTTMPLHLLHPLAVSMYSDANVWMGDSDRLEGHITIGSAPNEADTVVRIRLFRRANPGTADAEFGADFMLDVQHCDLSCTALYFDPFNNVLVDPTGYGINDVESKLLRLVCEDACQDPRDGARIALKVVKLKLLQYSPAPGQQDRLTSLFSQLPALSGIEFLSLLESEVCADLSEAEVAVALEEIRKAYNDLGELARFDETMRLRQRDRQL